MMKKNDGLARQGGSRGRWGSMARFVLPGAIVLGTSCLADIRKSLVAAGLDFVEGSAGLVLETVVPVEDLLTGE